MSGNEISTAVTKNNQTLIAITVTSIAIMLLTIISLIILLYKYGKCTTILQFSEQLMTRVRGINSGMTKLRRESHMNFENPTYEEEDLCIPVSSEIASDTN